MGFSQKPLIISETGFDAYNMLANTEENRIQGDHDYNVSEMLDYR